MKRKHFCKGVALALAAAAIATCFTACQSGDARDRLLDPSSPVAIEIWHYYNGPQKIAFDELVGEFNETLGREKGIVVEAISQGNVSQLLQKVMDAADKKVGASEIPDIFAAYADTAYKVNQLGLVANLSPYLTEEEISSYVTAYIEEGRLDSSGQLKIFPTAKSTEILMINQTDWNAFAQATGASQSELATVEGITGIAKRYYEWTDSLTPAEGDGKAFFGRDAMANYFIIGAKQLGSEIFEVTDGKVTLQADETVMRKLWDNFYIPYINGYFGAYGKFRTDDAKTGDLIALVGSNSGASYFPDKVTVNDTESYPIDLTVLPAPVFEGGKKVQVQQGAGMVVTKSDEKTEYASTVFLKWFTDADRNLAFCTHSGYLPVKTEANDAARFNEVVAQSQGDAAVAGQLVKALPVAMETVRTCELYTNKAFENGTAARNVLEDSMLDKAKADRASVQQKMGEGMSRAEAVAPYETDENFTQWLREIRSALEKAVG